uniref:Uncharacterized protein n=1 Tax=Arundo donax TaxID=35708 RepID=A0A0A9FTG9_ARUDO
MLIFQGVDKIYRTNKETAYAVMLTQSDMLHHSMSAVE